mgnify:CR=1 FL=1
MLETALSSLSGLPAFLIYFVLAIALLFMFTLIYTWITPHNELELIRANDIRETVHIRARKAVILASGGHSGNPEVRSMFYPALREPAFPTLRKYLQRG